MTPADRGWDYLGYRLAESGISYNCPRLKLWGYRGPAELESAVRSLLRKRAKAVAAKADRS